MQSGRQSGFTMIELMVTLTILVILAVLAVPTFADLIEKSRLRGATDDIVNLLNAARIRSTKAERQINVSIQGTSSWCAGAVAELGPATVGAAMTIADTPCDCTTSSNCTVPSASDTTSTTSDVMVVSSSSYSGVKLSSVSTDIAYVSTTSGGVTFNPKLGAVTDTSGNMLTTQPKIVVLSKSGKYSTQITVSPLGQTNVCVPSTSPFVAGYPSC